MEWREKPMQDKFDTNFKDTSKNEEGVVDCLE